ncbi:hypothetical protein CCAL12920_07465 [Campylobacter sp. RM12920]|uniref:Uncharacterized protein n=1 Tax=Campylobacter californiensis TaxID=1032243 RepID=A0ABD4JI54_9BACT|nr:hypothetical protein [Campylobacter sp. RM12919]MBE2988715.1 hypothetical protein [Campylobacter sp. RM12920]
MAIQENLTEIKKEIGAQEQFLESVIKSERFLKKYKKAIIFSAIIAVLGIAGFYGSKAINANRISAANEAYSKLILNPTDADALKILKEKEPTLYAIHQFKEAMRKEDIAQAKELLSLPIDPIVKQILSSQIGTQDGSILANYETLIKGYELLKEDKINEARAEFAKIPLDSPLMNLVKNLEHYQGNK